MSNAKKPIVHLRVYKGLQLFYDANGKVMNPTQLVKITYDTIEWKNFLKNIPSLGFSSVEVEKVLDGTTFEEIKITENILSDIKGVFKIKEAELTPDQKRIAELEAKLDKLTSKEEHKGINILEDLRKEYKDITGKEADARWKENKVMEQIEEFKKTQK